MWMAILLGSIFVVIDALATILFVEVLLLFGRKPGGVMVATEYKKIEIFIDSQVWNSDQSTVEILPKRVVLSLMNGKSKARYSVARQPNQVVHATFIDRKCGVHAGKLTIVAGHMHG